MCNLNLFPLPDNNRHYAENILEAKRQRKYINLTGVLDYIWFALVFFIMHTGPPEWQSVNKQSP